MHQVGKQSLSTGLGWGSEGGGGGWSLPTSTSGSGSWTSTANQDLSQTSTWQPVGKSDNASDAGDDSSSVKSGSTITNIGNITSQQSQDSTTTSAPGALPINSSSPWSTSAPLPGMESSPWGNSNSPAPSSMGTIGWSNTPSSLSMSSNNQGLQNNMQPGSSISNNTPFNSAIGNNSSSGWPSGIGSNPSSSTSMPPNMNSGLQSGTIQSQWQGGSMLGNIGDFSKSEPNWNNTTSSVIDSAINKENNSDPRLWGMAPDKMPDPQWDAPKSQWANSPVGPAGDQASNSNTELSFAQATQKGLKPPPVSANQSAASSRNEEILRAIENHEGWGSRPIRQDTTWDVESSPKSHRKFSTDTNAGASNVWNNSNGTAIWEAVRENQNSSWAGGAAVGGNSWNNEKDQPGWNNMPKTPQEHNWGAGAVGNGADSKSFGMWGGPGAAGDAGNKMWSQKTEIGSWEAGNGHQRQNPSAWGDDGEANNWDDQRRAPGGMNNSMQGMVPPMPRGVLPPGMPNMGNMAGMNADNAPWNDSQKAGWNQANAEALHRAKMDEPWNKPPPKMSGGWGEPGQDGGKVDDGTSIWAANAPKQLPPQAKPAGWGDNTPQGQWNAAVGAKPKTPGGWDEASWAMAQRAKQVPPKFIGTTGGGGGHTQMRAKLLQQLMDMGFRKEEAQNALITNNMNIEMAINDLKASNGMPRKDEMDMFQNNGPQGRMPPYKSNLGGDDMSDVVRSDQVPNFNSAMPNTPFPNAQMPNQPFLHNTSLPPSSLNPNNPSINSNIQQKLMQKMQVPPTNALGPRGQMPPVGSGSNNKVPAQQQQQILAELRMAILNGFISPQLLNYTLPHNILVLLQQLLQLQTARQNWLMKEQQMLAQGNRGNHRQQLEQMPTIIGNINQQMSGLQKQLQQAQNKLFSTQKPPNLSQPPSNIDPIDALSSELANSSIVNQSRLATHWKPLGDNMVGSDMSTVAPTQMNSGIDSNMDKSANTLQASSNLNLIGLGMTGDRTWSTVSTPSSSSQSWPTTSVDGVSTNPMGDHKTNTSLATSTLSAMPSGFSDVIPEFVPGKPWQGLPKSSIEDDPHMTPGSIQRSLSVNRVHDDSLNNLGGGYKIGNHSGWSSASKGDNSLGLGNLGSRPPPGMAPSKMLGSGPQWQQGNVSFNRQSSWAGRSSGNSAFTQVGGPGWGDSQNPISNWIFLKNLHSMDSATVRALCQRHGEVLQFSYLAEGQIALIQYATREVAMNAQRALNNFQMGQALISAEFINEVDAQRLISHQMPPPPPQPSAMTQMNASHWSQAPPTAFQQGNGRSGQIWGHGSNAWTGSTLWDGSSMGDHNSNTILSNILD